MAHWRSLLPHRLLEVELRDWVEDFSGTLARVLAFLELFYDPACERFFEVDRLVRTASASQVRRPINDQGIGRWRRYEAELAPLIDALAEAGLVHGIDDSRVAPPQPRPSPARGEGEGSSSAGALTPHAATAFS